MIVRTLDEVIGTDRDVSATNWNSRRLLLAEDRLGFSLHDTLIHAGTETTICYRNHLEAVYCIEGRGVVRLLPDGPDHPICPGMVYALDCHDHHLLIAETTLRLICVFNPAVTGTEVHDETGAYPASSPSEDNPTSEPVTLSKAMSPASSLQPASAISSPTV